MTALISRCLTSLDKLFSRLLLALLIFFSAINLFAGSEEEMKAVFLEKFTHLVQWPENNESSFLICILNDETFAETLQHNYRKKVFKKKPINIIKLKTDTTTPFCDILFIGKNTPDAHTITKKLAKEPVLTVSDDQNHISDKVMISIYFKNRRFTYSINNKAAQEADIKISYLLLKSASEVIR